MVGAINCSERTQNDDFIFSEIAQPGLSASSSFVANLPRAESSFTKNQLGLLLLSVGLKELYLDGRTKLRLLDSTWEQEVGMIVPYPYSWQPNQPPMMVKLRLQLVHELMQYRCHYLPRV